MIPMMTLVTQMTIITLALVHHSTLSLLPLALHHLPLLRWLNRLSVLHWHYPLYMRYLLYLGNLLYMLYLGSL